VSANEQRQIIEENLKPDIVLSSFNARLMKEGELFPLHGLHRQTADAKIYRVIVTLFLHIISMPLFFFAICVASSAKCLLF